jgi:hypothetical protein
MAKSVLHIIETAYRATLEEQDDPVLWLSESLALEGVSSDVLLRGNAVSYLVFGQDAAGLQFGARCQTRPPHLPSDLHRLLDAGVCIHYVDQDLVARGIDRSELIVGPRPIDFHRLPELLAGYEHVWHW